MPYRVGQTVAVSGIEHSEWANARGVIVETIQPDAGSTAGQEYKVRFAGGQQRWFLAGHLVEAGQDQVIRFFRAEVMEYWRQLDPDRVARLDGDPDELAALLQESFGFAARRARQEVGQFVDAFHARLDRAKASGESQPTVRRHSKSLKSREPFLNLSGPAWRQIGIYFL
jgi:hypothetical protein